MNRHMDTRMNRQMETDQIDSQLDRPICGQTDTERCQEHGHSNGQIDRTDGQAVGHRQMNRHMATQMNRQMEIQADQMDSQLDRHICGQTDGRKDARSTQSGLFYRTVIDEEKKF